MTHELLTCKWCKVAKDFSGKTGLYTCFHNLCLAWPIHNVCTNPTNQGINIMTNDQKHTMILHAFILKID